MKKLFCLILAALITASVGGGDVWGVDITEYNGNNGLVGHLPAIVGGDVLNVLNNIKQIEGNTNNNILDNLITINGNGFDFDGNLRGGFYMENNSSTNPSEINNANLTNYGVLGYSGIKGFVVKVKGDNSLNKSTLNLKDVNVLSNIVDDAAVIADGGQIYISSTKDIKFSETKDSSYNTKPDFLLQNSGRIYFLPGAGTNIEICDGIRGDTNEAIYIGNGLESASGTVLFNGAPKNDEYTGKVFVNKATIKLLKDTTYFTNADHEFNNGTFDIANGKIETINFKNLEVKSGGMKANIDVDLANKTSDKIRATNPNIIGKLTLSIGNLMGDAAGDQVKIDDLLNFSAPADIMLDPNQSKVGGSLYMYDVKLDNDGTNTYLLLARAADMFSSKVMQSKVANSGAAVLAQNVSLSVLTNSGNYTLFQKHGINSGDVTARDGVTMWVRGFGGSEKLDLKEEYAKIDTMFYGGTIGFDIDRIYTDKLFATYGLFASYAGSELKDTDNNNKVLQNGGYAGIRGIWYLNKFYLSALADYGIVKNEISTSEGSTDFNSHMVTVAGELGYNWQAEYHSVTLQPNVGVMASYLMSDEYYITSGGKELKIINDNATLAAVAPGLRLVKNLGRCWILSFDGKYVITSGTGGDVRVNDINLPDMNYGNYTNIGLGLEKMWGYTILHLKGSKSFGGRDGVTLNAGIEFKF